MMVDLFSFQDSPELIKLEGADIQYWHTFPLKRSADQYLEALLRATPWRQESIRLWGKVHQQPRLVAWYGDPGKSYSYSGVKLEPLPWTELLQEIKNAVERETGSSYNSVLLNYYRDGNDSMGFHSDDEPELGLRPTIASVSFGEKRFLVFKCRRESSSGTKVPLEHGSLLLMQGDTQQLYKHGIAKERGITSPRINLTFRRINR